MVASVFTNSTYWKIFAGKLKKVYEMEEMIKPIGRPKKEPI